MKKESGVYKIINTINGKIYVGSTIDFNYRKTLHFSQLRNGKHYNDHLQRAWDKYGEEFFTFEIIERCEVEVLLLTEQKWIDQLKTVDPAIGYNKNPLAGKYYNIPIPVAQLSLEGELLEVFPSVKDATMSILGDEKSYRDDISSVLRGKQKTAFGFLWIEYKRDTLYRDIKEYLLTQIKQSQLIEQIDIKTGQRVGLYEGVKSAERALGLNPGNSCIFQCLKGNYKSANGFHWRRFEFVANRTPTYYLGMDVGKNGGFALIKEDESIIYTMVTPTIKGKEIDLQVIAQYLSAWQGYIKGAVIEDVHSLFGVGAKSNFQFGRALGILEGMTAAMQIPFIKIAPKKWQDVMFEGVSKIMKPSTKKIVESTKLSKGRGSVDTKAMAEVAAKRLFPKLDLRKSIKCENNHDGIIDALLMAKLLQTKNL